MSAQVLFSRYEDGARPVKVLPDGWEVLRPDGTSEGKYNTTKGLLYALTGHPEGRHWSLDRYFKQGPLHGTPHRPLVESNVFDIFGYADPLIATTPGITIPRETEESAVRKKNQGQILSPNANLAIRRKNRGQILSPNPVLGIDLVRRADEVRKLLYAGFGRRMYQAGYDPEEVLQEVYKGLLVRNKGRCPWDPAKSSFGHYVHMVCSCILSNYHRKQYRVREVEQLGLPGPQEDAETRTADVASNITVPAEPTVGAEGALLCEQVDDLVDYMMDSPLDAEGRLAVRLVPLLLAGTPRKDIAPTLGVSKALVTRALNLLRAQAHAWRESPACVMAH